MKLTTKGRYAVTAILDIALNVQNGPVNLAAIAERQALSVSYLEQLLARLKKAGLVHAIRGPGGGYLLGMPAEDIAVGAVIQAVNENVEATRCSGVTGCQGGLRCLTHDLWQDLSDQIHQFLDGISLADLVQRESIREVARQQTQKSDEHQIVVLKTLQNDLLPNEQNI